MIRTVSCVVATILALSGCSGDDSFQPTPDAGGAPSSTADLDVCSLLTAAELTSVLGEAPAPEPSEPAGPFTGCSWGVGTVLVSVAATGSLILAPGEDGCPSAGLGDESHACEGRVKFLTGGIHVTVSTIDPFVDDQALLDLAAIVLPKVAP